MIRLFEKDETDFDGNGICVLSPTVCTVSEIAGGSYTLHLEHPIDEHGKFALLTEERIIKAPVPPVHIPAITLPTVYVYVTNAQASLYSTIPTYVSADVQKVRQNPSRYAWGGSIEYRTNELVTYSSKIYRAKKPNFSQTPTNTAFWKYVTTVAASSAAVIETIAANKYVYKTADYNAAYMQVRSMNGNVGYIERSKCTYDQTSDSGQVIPALDIGDQLFRIYKIYGEDDNQTICADAKHISYDFQGNGLYSCNVSEADPMTAVSLMRGALVDEDNRAIVCDVSGSTVTQDWSFLNPINALLDPDNGLVPVLGARLVRNNADFYILSNDSPRQGIRIAYGVNMTGVQWSRNIENVIAKVIPRCGDGSNGYLYIDSLYVESEIAAEYAVKKIEMLDCGFSVGDQYTKADGTEITLTAESAKTIMEEKAQDRFDVDHADAVEVELEVSFLLLGDTEEYKQYRGLQTVCLYDEITVDMRQSRMTATAQVSEYEYDAILRRYNSIKVSSIKNMQRKIPGYRLKAGSITYEKLGSSLISKIRSSGSSGT